MRNLLLTKPLVFIDIESSGLNPYSDRIVEISLLKLSPDGSKEFMSNLVNPGIPIPLETTEIHGICDNDVKDKPTFNDVADNVNRFISDCDISGFNIKRFDLPMLETELRRVGLKLSRQGRGIVDLQVIYHSYERRDLESAYLRYCGKKLEGMHRSGVDVKACLEILAAQVGLYDELPNDIQGLHQFCCSPGESNWIDTTGKFIMLEGDILFNFGKYKGRLLKEIVESDRDYLMWILHQSDFPLDAHEIVLSVLNE